MKLRYYRPEKRTNVQLSAVWYLKKQAPAGSADQKKQANNTKLQKIAVQTLDCAAISGRGLLTLGTIELRVPDCENNAAYILRFSLTSDNADDIVNEYDVFIYEGNRHSIDHNNKETNPVCITSDTDTALAECGKGASVLLFVKPDSALPDSRLKGEYCTDFWCYPMFRSISEGAGKPVPVGTMGLLIDTDHPALAGFVCEEHTTAQWYQIVMHSQPRILDSTKETKDIKPIVRMMDNFERNHNLGLIYEVERENGKMLVCEADLLTLRSEYPEADCLYRSLVDYVQSEKFLRREKE